MNSMINYVVMVSLCFSLVGCSKEARERHQQEMQKREMADKAEDGSSSDQQRLEAFRQVRHQKFVERTEREHLHLIVDETNFSQCYVEWIGHVACEDGEPRQIGYVKDDLGLCFRVQEVRGNKVSPWLNLTPVPCEKLVVVK